MEQVRYLVVGAGISGLSFANFIDDDDYLILDADREIGGYCKTVHQDGFVWDYSGHFFHFKHKEIEQYLLDRMPADEVKVVNKQTFIQYKDRWIDFPFQKNIHQLPQDEFVECLYDLFFRHESFPPERPADNFEQMLYQKFGRGIAERFLVPYNEKLYACALSELDVDAMGRFFPYADIADIVRNMRRPDNASYNSTFTYPRGGAIQYVNALASEVDPQRLALGEPLVAVDLRRKVARTPQREIAFEYLVSSVPFDRFAAMAGLEVPEGALSYNKVEIFNLGFDRKGPENIHWLYFPERDYGFYRLGFYDNIFGTDRLSMYVEIGHPPGATIDSAAQLERVLADLRRAGVIDDHQLVSWHTIVLDPAYVHITKQSTRLFEQASQVLAARGAYSIGRYGGWKYCSIEDNILEARALAEVLNRADRA